MGSIFSIMIRFMGGYESPYYAGFNMLFLARSLLLPLDIGVAIVADLMLYLAYLIPILVFDQITNWPIFINNNFFLVGTISLALLSTYIGNLYRWREFINTYKLDQSNQELAKAKGHLETSYQKLQELDRLKTQFFSNISHEFRTPLTLILAPVDSLLKDGEASSAEARKKALQVIQGNALRLLRLINHILDLIKIDAQQMKLVLSKISLRSFLKEVYELLLPLAQQKNITFEITSNVQASIFLDRSAIEKVLLNLIYNAIKFTPSGGSIYLWAETSPSETFIHIQDTGIGIAPEMHEKIFNRFSQISSDASRQYEGTGIGLALSKEIVELHGGKITVQSELGKGSLFTVVLPHLTIQEDQAVTTPDHPNDEFLSKIQRDAFISGADLMLETNRFENIANVSSSGKPIVLIAEDNPDLSGFIASELGADYEIHIARDGQEALNILTIRRPDLIVSDIMMPGMSGYDFCKAVKSKDSTRDIPFIFLTAKAELPMKLEGYEIGADDYIIKPFQMQELQAKIKALLTLKKMEVSLKEKSMALEAALEKLQKARDERLNYVSQMAASLAHELRNPLQPIRTYIEVLDENKQNPDFIHRMIESVTPSLDRMDLLVKQLMNLGKIEKPHLGPVNIHKILDEAVSILEPKFKAKEVILEKSYHVDQVILQADPHQLSQVFFNLAKNALDALSANQTLKIKTQLINREDGSFIEISFEDNGPGIDEETLKKIFEPFFTTKKEGTGLGLCISKQIVEAHHGTLTAHSTLGKGSVFKVSLGVQFSE